MTASDQNVSIDVEAVVLAPELIVDDVDTNGHSPTADVAEYACWLGDDALVLAQQLGWWISRAPELEEDVALANIALDLLGHARALLHYAGRADGRTEDDLAYWRDEPEFRCAWLFEQPNGDFAHTIVRQLIAAIYFDALYAALSHSNDPSLAAIAAKAVKEVAYHRDHATQWTLRLALGTDESRRRAERALVDLWPYVDELTTDHPLVERLDGVAVVPASLRAAVDAGLDEVLVAADLERPSVTAASGGGRDGRHTSHLGYLLAELQVLARQHPGARW